MSVKLYLENFLTEKKMWSGKVETEWHPKEGFFSQSAEKIASGLKSASKDLKQAASRLNFYINRAGKNLSADDKARLKLAKEKLHGMYESNMNESATKMVTLSRDIMGREPHTRGTLIYKKGTKVKIEPASNLPNYKKEKLFWVIDPKEPEGGAGTLLTPEDFSECVNEAADKNKKLPGESNAAATERIGKQNEKKGPTIKNIKEYPTGNPGKYEYKSVDARTTDGIKEAEKLQAQGWKVISTGDKYTLERLKTK